jgi:class 3 adenylate cyclase
MQLQNIHDSIIREAIAKHGGYEICTEGDSFQIAFGSCHAALAMAMDVQYRLLEANWPKNVLAQNACRVVTGEGACSGCWDGPQ